MAAVRFAAAVAIVVCRPTLAAVVAGITAAVVRSVVVGCMDILVADQVEVAEKSVLASDGRCLLVVGTTW